MSDTRRGDRRPDRHHRGATMHGTRRIRKRFKLPARAAHRLVQSALADGIREEDMPSWAKLIVKRKKELHRNSLYRLYRNFLFIFADDPDQVRLITVYAVDELDPDWEDPDWTAIRAQKRFH